MTRWSRHGQSAGLSKLAEQVASECFFSLHIKAPIAGCAESPLFQVPAMKFLPLFAAVAASFILQGEAHAANIARQEIGTVTRVTGGGEEEPTTYYTPTSSPIKTSSTSSVKPVSTTSTKSTSSQSSSTVKPTSSSSQTTPKPSSSSSSGSSTKPQSSSTQTGSLSPTKTSSGSSPSCSPYQQCGGIAYKGCTICSPGYKCVFSNEWYSQCVPI